MTCRVEGCSKKPVGRGLCSSHWQRWKKYGDHSAGGTPKGACVAFLHRAYEYDSAECLLWPYGTIHGGYGSVRVEGKTQRASRLVCAHYHGAPPFAKAEAAHSCGNPRCVNWRHLRWASHKENDDDKLLHGTRYRGEQMGTAKLTEAQIRMIRASELSQRKAAVLFGTSQANIGLIRQRKRWGHVDHP